MSIERRNFNLGIFTWNLSGKAPDEDVNFSKIFASKSIEEVPDIIIFGFQEVIQLKLTNVFNNVGSEKIKHIKEKILGKSIYISQFLFNRRPIGH
jgi:hypothetical protein